MAAQNIVFGAADRDAQMGGQRRAIEANRQQQGFMGQLPQLMAAQQPNAWTPSPFAAQTPYAQAMIQPAQARAGTDAYTAQLGLLGQMQQQPWNLAQTAQAAVPQAGAQQYGAYAGGLADILGAYYPAAANVQTAHFPAAAQMYGTDVGANLQRDISQMGHEAKSANLYQMLQALAPMLTPRPAPQGFTTSYAAGIS